MSVPTFDASGPAEDVAEQVLRRLVSDKRGGLPLPIDPVDLARKLGAKVFTMELESTVSAMLEGDGVQPPRIYLNLFDSLERRRFSCAHEIGHLLRRRSTGVEQFGFIDRRDHLSSTGTDPEEVWANRFASSLLMPAELMRTIPAAQRRHPARLAPTFGVSPQAMEIRLSVLARQ